MAIPDELLKEAAEAESMAAIATHEKDREWLLAKALELRRLASRAEQVARREGTPMPVDVMPGTIPKP